MGAQTAEEPAEGLEENLRAGCKYRCCVKLRNPFNSMFLNVRLPSWTGRFPEPLQRFRAGACGADPSAV